MASNTKNVKLGVCKVFFDGSDLGFTQGGVEASVKTDTHKVNVDQLGKTTINETIIGREVMAKVPLAETTLANMVRIMPGASLNYTGGSNATGSITIATNPSNGDTVIVNGKTFTFKTVAAVDGDVALGATAALTAAALAAALSASTDQRIAAASYTAVGAAVNIVWGNPTFFPSGQPAAEGNSFTLNAGTAGAKVTLSGATLTGGADPTSVYVSVPTGIGLNLLDFAFELRLHPINKLDTDRSDDFVIPFAATPGALTFAYKLENERIYNCDFTGYPNPSTYELFRIGN